LAQVSFELFSSDNNGFICLSISSSYLSINMSQQFDEEQCLLFWTYAISVMILSAVVNVSLMQCKPKKKPNAYPPAGKGDPSKSKIEAKSKKDDLKTHEPTKEEYTLACNTKSGLGSDDPDLNSDLLKPDAATPAAGAGGGEKEPSDNIKEEPQNGVPGFLSNDKNAPHYVNLDPVPKSPVPNPDPSSNQFEMMNEDKPKTEMNDIKPTDMSKGKPELATATDSSEKKKTKKSGKKSKTTVNRPNTKVNNKGRSNAALQQSSNNFNRRQSNNLKF
jgi:hypothetical protein